MSHLVTLIPGHGIGPEVTEATRLVLDPTDLGLAEAGATALGPEGPVDSS